MHYITEFNFQEKFEEILREELEKLSADWSLVDVEFVPRITYLPDKIGENRVTLTVLEEFEFDLSKIDEIFGSSLKVVDEADNGVLEGDLKVWLGDRWLDFTYSLMNDGHACPEQPYGTEWHRGAVFKYTLASEEIKTDSEDKDVVGLIEKGTIECIAKAIHCRLSSFFE